jgi:predicted ribosome quality control (RQC) complex YloA/Tae2 family protein
VKVPQETNKVLSKRDKDQSNRAKLMSDVFYAQNLFREAFPERRYGSVKAALYEAHRFLSRKVAKEFTYRRARSIHEGTARRIDAEEMEALKLALIEESKREQQNLRARLASLDEAIAAYEAASHRQAVARQSEEVGR